MSGKILELRRWEPCSYQPDGPEGGEVRMELRRLRRGEVRGLKRVLVVAAGEIGRAGEDGLSSTQKAEVMANIWDALPAAELETLFSECVRNVELKIDGVPITDGPGLLAEAPDGLVLWALFALQRLAGLSSAEAFHSGSRSMSSAETASLPALPGSDATSTGNGDGPHLSTVTVTPIGPTSFSGLEGA